MGLQQLRVCIDKQPLISLLDHPPRHYLNEKNHKGINVLYLPK